MGVGIYVYFQSMLSRIVLIYCTSFLYSPDLNRKRRWYTWMSPELLSPLQSLDSHFFQTFLRLALREMAYGRNGSVCIFLCESAGLLQSVTLQHQFSCLRVSLALHNNYGKRVFTLATSPASANFLPTKLPNCLSFLHAKSKGAVASPSSRSAPAGFPNSASLIV